MNEDLATLDLFQLLERLESVETSLRLACLLYAYLEHI